MPNNMSFQPLGLTPMSCDELNALFRLWDGHLEELRLAGCSDRSVLPHKVTCEHRRHSGARAKFALRALARTNRAAAAVAAAVEAQLLRTLG